MTSTRGRAAVLGERVVIAGGSIAGLLAARVLSPHFGRVTLIERDVLPAHPAWRKGAAQSHHGHGLLVAGARVLDRLFPELFEALAAAGASTVDTSAQINWFHFGTWKQRFQSGVSVHMQSRELLEHAMRSYVRDLPNVAFEHATVTGLDLRAAPRIQLDGGREEAAELYVDASGRGSRLAEWFAASGYPVPATQKVGVRVNYTSARFRSSSARDWRGLLIYPEPPGERRGGGAFPMEDGTCVVTLIGWHDEVPGATDQEFLEFARSLPHPELFAFLQGAVRASPYRSYRYSQSIWHRHDRLPRYPRGLCVLGDAVCCFDPVFGQGMAAAALSAELLAHCSERARTLPDLVERFRRGLPRVLQVPWQLAAMEDQRFPLRDGPKPAFGTAAMNWYSGHVYRLTGTDPEVYLRFARVIHLLEPPTSLFHPSVLGKVALSVLRGPRRVRERPTSVSSP